MFTLALTHTPLPYRLHPHPHLHHHITPTPALHLHTPPESASPDRRISCVVPSYVGDRQYEDSLRRREGQHRQGGSQHRACVHHRSGSARPTNTSAAIRQKDKVLIIREAPYYTDSVNLTQSQCCKRRCSTRARSRNLHTFPSGTIEALGPIDFHHLSHNLFISRSAAPHGCGANEAVCYSNFYSCPNTYRLWQSVPVYYCVVLARRVQLR